MTVGGWLGWPMALLLAAWTGWRLRLRPSPDVRVWRQQALMQRNTAEVLRPLFEQAYLVQHDVALPGWLDSLDHLVVDPTGVWVVGSLQHRQLLPCGSPSGRDIRLPRQGGMTDVANRSSRPPSMQSEGSPNGGVPGRPPTADPRRPTAQLETKRVTRTRADFGYAAGQLGKSASTRAGLG